MTLWIVESMALLVAAFYILGIVYFALLTVGLARYIYKNWNKP